MPRSPDHFYAPCLRNAGVGGDQGYRECDRGSRNEAIERITQRWQGARLRHVGTVQWQQQERGRRLD